MKHAPAVRYRLAPQLISHSRAPRGLPLTTALLLAALAFVTGFTAAVYTVGFIVTAR